MLDPHHILQVPIIGGTGVYSAMQLAGEVRIEFDHIVSLLDSGLELTVDAQRLDCPGRLRGLNLARVSRDLAALNALRLGEVEAALQRRAAVAVAELGCPHWPLS